MTAAKKNKWSIIAVGSTVGALLAIWGFADKVNARVKEKYLTPIIDCRIEEKQRFNNEKLEVLYMFNMEKARQEGNIDLWNSCVDKAQSQGKVNRIRHR
jgi:hypothetical protein